MNLSLDKTNSISNYLDMLLFYSKSKNEYSSPINDYKYVN